MVELFKGGGFNLCQIFALYERLVLNKILAALIARFLNLLFDPHMIYILS